MRFFAARAALLRWFTTTLIGLCCLASVACGGRDSSSLGGTAGSALAITGTIAGANFVARDAVSIVASVDSKYYLVILFSDTTGLCEQVGVGLDANSALFYAVAVDTILPEPSDFTVMDPNGATVLNRNAYAAVYGRTAATQQPQYASSGTLSITYQGTSDKANTAGSITATSADKQTTLTGKFEAPYCAALSALFGA